MKKWLCVLATLALLCVSMTACAETEEQPTTAPSALNPEGYPYFMVLEVAEGPQVEGLLPLTVKGCFGDYQMYDDEEDVSSMGFDMDNPCAVQLAEDCEILMPVDFYDNIMDVVPCEDLLAWYQQQSDGENMDIPLSFHTKLEFNDQGFVTRMEYVYFPWG